MLWSDFQDTADRLARGAVEGDWRSAISRTYYAVFHYFREYFLSHGFDVGRGGQSHFNLYSGLSNCGLTSVAVLGRRVDQLRTDRTKADYNLGTRIDQAYALDAVRRGRAVVADFQAHLNSVPASQIVAGVRRHLKSIGRIP